MTKIKNIEDLRNTALETLEKLAAGEIDTATAGVTGKLCEGVISTIKTQLEYARMLDREPNIPFMGTVPGSGNLIEAKSEPKALGHKK